MKTRKEFDSIGGINVPSDKYWGASTQRSKKFFNIGKIFVPTSIIRSIAIIKRSAAIVHRKDKSISPKISKAIIRASNEIISGKMIENFPLKVWQTGSGTQTNMNVNEVIANRAIEILKGKKGSKNQYIPMIMLINLNLQTTFFQLQCTSLLRQKQLVNFYQV